MTKKTPNIQEGAEYATNTVQAVLTDTKIAELDLKSETLTSQDPLSEKLTELLHSDATIRAAYQDVLNILGANGQPRDVQKRLQDAIDTLATQASTHRAIAKLDVWWKKFNTLSPTQQQHHLRESIKELPQTQRAMLGYLITPLTSTYQDYASIRNALYDKRNNTFTNSTMHEIITAAGSEEMRNIYCSIDPFTGSSKTETTTLTPPPPPPSSKKSKKSDALEPTPITQTTTILNPLTGTSLRERLHALQHAFGDSPSDSIPSLLSDPTVMNELNAYANYFFDDLSLIKTPIPAPAGPVNNAYRTSLKSKATSLGITLTLGTPVDWSDLAQKTTAIQTLIKNQSMLPDYRPLAEATPAEALKALEDAFAALPSDVSSYTVENFGEIKQIYDEITVALKQTGLNRTTLRTKIGENSTTIDYTNHTKYFNKLTPINQQYERYLRDTETLTEVRWLCDELGIPNARNITVDNLAASQQKLSNAENLRRDVDKTWSPRTFQESIIAINTTIAAAKTKIAEIKEDAEKKAKLTARQQAETTFERLPDKKSLEKPWGETAARQALATAEQAITDARTAWWTDAEIPGFASYSKYIALKEALVGIAWLTSSQVSSEIAQLTDPKKENFFRNTYITNNPVLTALEKQLLNAELDRRIEALEKERTDDSVKKMSYRNDEISKLPGDPNTKAWKSAVNDLKKNINKDDTLIPDHKKTLQRTLDTRVKQLKEQASAKERQRLLDQIKKISTRTDELIETRRKQIIQNKILTKQHKKDLLDEINRINAGELSEMEAWKGITTLWWNKTLVSTYKTQISEATTLDGLTDVASTIAADGTLTPAEKTVLWQHIEAQEKIIAEQEKKVTYLNRIASATTQEGLGEIRAEIADKENDGTLAKETAQELSAVIVQRSDDLSASAKATYETQIQAVTNPDNISDLAAIQTQIKANEQLTESDKNTLITLATEKITELTEQASQKTEAEALLQPYTTRITDATTFANLQAARDEIVNKNPPFDLAQLQTFDQQIENKRQELKQRVDAWNDSDDRSLLETMGDAANKQQDYEQAIRYYNAWLQRDPRDTWLQKKKRDSEITYKNALMTSWWQKLENFDYQDAYDDFQKANSVISQDNNIISDSDKEFIENMATLTGYFAQTKTYIDAKNKSGAITELQQAKNMVTDNSFDTYFTDLQTQIDELSASEENKSGVTWRSAEERSLEDYTTLPLDQIIDGTYATAVEASLQTRWLVLTATDLQTSEGVLDQQTATAIETGYTAYRRWFEDYYYENKDKITEQTISANAPHLNNIANVDHRKAVYLILAYNQEHITYSTVEADWESFVWFVNYENDKKADMDCDIIAMTVIDLLNEKSIPRTYNRAFVNGWDDPDHVILTADGVNIELTRATLQTKQYGVPDQSYITTDPFNTPGEIIGNMMSIRGYSYTIPTVPNPRKKSLLAFQLDQTWANSKDNFTTITQDYFQNIQSLLLPDNTQALNALQNIYQAFHQLQQQGAFDTLSTTNQSALLGNLLTVTDSRITIRKTQLKNKPITPAEAQTIKSISTLIDQIKRGEKEAQKDQVTSSLAALSIAEEEVDPSITAWSETITIQSISTTTCVQENKKKNLVPSTIYALDDSQDPAVDYYPTYHKRYLAVHKAAVWKESSNIDNSLINAGSTSRLYAFSILTNGAIIQNFDRKKGWGALGPGSMIAGNPFVKEQAVGIEFATVNGNDDLTPEQIAAFQLLQAYLTQEIGTIEHTITSRQAVSEWWTAIQMEDWVHTDFSLLSEKEKTALGIADLSRYGKPFDQLTLSELQTLKQKIQEKIQLITTSPKHKNSERDKDFREKVELPKIDARIQELQQQEQPREQTAITTLTADQCADRARKEEAKSNYDLAITYWEAATKKDRQYSTNLQQAKQAKEHADITKNLTNIQESAVMTEGNVNWLISMKAQNKLPPDLTELRFPNISWLSWLDKQGNSYAPTALEQRIVDELCPDITVKVDHPGIDWQNATLDIRTKYAIDAGLFTGNYPTDIPRTFDQDTRLYAQWLTKQANNLRAGEPTIYLPAINYQQAGKIDATTGRVKDPYDMYRRYIGNGGSTDYTNPVVIGSDEKNLAETDYGHLRAIKTTQLSLPRLDDIQDITDLWMLIVWPLTSGWENMSLAEKNSAMQHKYTALQEAEARWSMQPWRNTDNYPTIRTEKLFLGLNNLTKDHTDESKRFRMQKEGKTSFEETTLGKKTLANERYKIDQIGQTLGVYQGASLTLWLTRVTDETLLLHLFDGLKQFGSRWTRATYTHSRLTLGMPVLTSNLAQHISEFSVSILTLSRTTCTDPEAFASLLQFTDRTTNPQKRWIIALPKMTISDLEQACRWLNFMLRPWSTAHSFGEVYTEIDVQELIDSAQFENIVTSLNSYPGRIYLKTASAGNAKIFYYMQKEQLTKVLSDDTEAVRDKSKKERVSKD